MSTDETPPEPAAYETGRQVSGVFFLAFVLAIFGTLIILSVVFATLSKPNGLFAFLFLMAALTVAFVGILGGTGKIEWKWITLGGAPAVYMGLIWLVLRPDGGLMTIEDLNEMVNFDAKVQEEVRIEMAELESAHALRREELEADFRARQAAADDERDSRVLFIKFLCREESVYLSQIRAQLQFTDTGFSEEPTFINFRNNHGDDFDEPSGIIRPFNVSGAYVLPVPILSDGSGAVIYHEGQDTNVRPPLLEVKYDDAHPDLTVIVSDRQQMEWGCTRQFMPQESGDPFQ